MFAAHEISVAQTGGESFRFQRGVARIDGLARHRDGRTLLWLSFPKSHAFNPFIWYFDFALSKQLTAVLLGNGAAISDWPTFADEC